jgi:hypothetical protein
MDGEMRSDAEVQLKYASKYARIANGWKKWIGQIEGVQFSKGLDRKRKLEAEFTARIAADANLWDKYSGLLAEIAVNNTQIAEGQLKRNEFIETVYYGIEWFSLVSKLQSAKSDVDMKVELNAFHQNYSRTVSEKTTAAMLSLALKTFPGLLGDMDEATFVRSVHNEVDTLIELATKDQSIDLETVAPVANKFNQAAFQSFYTVSPSNNLLQKATELSAEYMRALMEVFPERNFYPDANSTLRVTYGKLEGVSPRDAVSYGTTTYLDGAMAKYKPGDYEFDMPAKLIELNDNKDFGDYAENGKLPVCNIASNHTTGGNSGSPVLNARGELIGLNFDRIWEGTMSDVNFDPSICRNIMVDSRYVLFIIDKFAGQRWLIDEMELVK